MIFVTSVTKKFGSKTAVDNISFKAKQGEIIGFLGPNGAGKTTTMRLLIGYLTPTEGVITIDDLNPADNRIAVLKKIGYLPENNPLYTEMKVKEYLDFISKIKGEKNYQQMINNVGLADVINTKIEELTLTANSS